MPLYRAIYIPDDTSPRGITFWAESASAATKYTDIVIASILAVVYRKVEMLTILPIQSIRVYRKHKLKYNRRMERLI